MQLFIRLFVGLADHRRVLHTPNHSVYVHRSSSSLGVVGTQDLWHVHQGPQPGLLLPPSTKSDKNQRAIATQPLPPAVGPLRCFPSRPPAPHAQRRDKKDGLHCMPSPPPTAVPALPCLSRALACLPARPARRRQLPRACGPVGLLPSPSRNRKPTAPRRTTARHDTTRGHPPKSCGGSFARESTDHYCSRAGGSSSSHAPGTARHHMPPAGSGLRMLGTGRSSVASPRW